MTWYPNRARTVQQGLLAQHAPVPLGASRGLRGPDPEPDGGSDTTRKTAGLRKGAAHSAVTGGLPNDRAHTTSKPPRSSGAAPGLFGSGPHDLDPSSQPSSLHRFGQEGRPPLGGVQEHGPGCRASAGPGPGRAVRRRIPGPATDRGRRRPAHRPWPARRHRRIPGRGRPARRGPWGPGGPGTGPARGLSQGRRPVGARHPAHGLDRSPDAGPMRSPVGRLGVLRVAVGRGVARARSRCSAGAPRPPTGSTAPRSR